MINPYQGPRMEICQRHNQPITSYIQAQSFCYICLEEQAGAVSVDLLKKKLEEIQSKQNQTNQEQHELLQSQLNSLVTYKNDIINQLDKLILIVKQQIEQIDKSPQSFQEMIDQTQNQQELIIKLEKKLDNQQENFKSFRTQIGNLQQSFYQKFIKMNPILDEFKQNQVLDKQNVPKKIKILNFVSIDEQMNNDKYQYELIEKSMKKEDGKCFAFSFNKDNSVLAVAFSKYIIINEFAKGELKKELQRLDGGSYWICCLYFMKQSNCLVSGNSDGQIIIWNLDNNNQLFAQQELMKHQCNCQVLCIVMNKIEDLLISCSNDKNIIFQRRQSSRWLCNQTINMNYSVYALSLNESENILISCGQSRQISIMEYQQNDQQWIIIQTIDVSEQGRRLCFTIGNQFVFQPVAMNYLEIYDYDQINKKFLKLSQIEVQSCEKCNCLFPCQYIKQLNILTVKHGGFFNIFKVNQNGNYQIIQTIKYKKQVFLYGCLSDDGQYLVIWDIISKEIQVRELRFIQ